MPTLFVIFDPQYLTFREHRLWLEQQESYFDFCFLVKGSHEAECRVPGIEKHAANKQLTVVTEDGAVYEDPASFIMCLYALCQYREHAMRLAAPPLLPFARQTFEYTANHHAGFLKCLRHFSDDEMAAVLEKYPPSICGRATFHALLDAKKNALNG